MRKHLHKIFLFFAFLSLVAFNFNDNPPSNWYQQFLSIPGSQQINDMTFLDSLTGFIVTSRNVNPDSATIFKTTNGGDNWSVVYNQSNRRLSRIKFINNNTGFASGGTGTGTPHLYKTTNQGINWNLLPITTGNSFWEDMSVLNEDTIWCVDKNSFNGGVYRTTNGGNNWQYQYGAGNLNPRRIYFYNGRIGFISDETSDRSIKKTTDSGLNWFTVFNLQYIRDIHFIDSLTGWVSSGVNIYKTTNGGANWILQLLPYNSSFISEGISQMAVINKDTIWAVGASYFYGAGQFRGLLYRTTNGGTNWGYQIPDSSFHITSDYNYVQFINKRVGWAYVYNRGIHTTNGGDTSFLTDVKQTSSEIPNQYSLSQNYPNPFNPTTIINYQLIINSFIALKVFDLNGKEITTLISQKQNAGIYTINFDADEYNLSSGIYFYTLQTENFKETKKMILIK